MWDLFEDILLDIATAIELSPADRRIAENRYRRLKTHLERPSSPLAPYLKDGLGLIYAQGSIATTLLAEGSRRLGDVDGTTEPDQRVPAAIA